MNKSVVIVFALTLLATVLLLAVKSEGQTKVTELTAPFVVSDFHMEGMRNNCSSCHSQ